MIAVRSAAGAGRGGAVAIGLAVGAYGAHEAREFIKKTKQQTYHIPDTHFDKVDDLQDSLKKMGQSEIVIANALNKLKDFVGFDEIVINQVKGQTIYNLVYPQQDDLNNIVITAPPGSGKTSLAKVLAEIIIATGQVPKNQILELTRGDLVKGVVGGSTDATAAALTKGEGGVIIIDEAHGLADEKGLPGYGKEVITMLIQFMTSHKDTVIIFCGYPEPMEHLLNQDEGFRRRIGWHYKLPTPKPNDLMEIFRRMADKQGFTLTQDADNKLGMIFQVEYANFPNNGGDVENLVTKMKVMNAEHATHQRGPSNLFEFSEQDAMVGFEKYLSSRGFNPVGNAKPKRGINLKSWWNNL
jgi:SpoVK/Ycf46/Vps4 family AAA+-type ATPase